MNKQRALEKLAMYTSDSKKEKVLCLYALDLWDKFYMDWETMWLSGDAEICAQNSWMGTNVDILMKYVGLHYEKHGELFDPSQAVERKHMIQLEEDFEHNVMVSLKEWRDIRTGQSWLCEAHGEHAESYIKGRLAIMREGLNAVRYILRGSRKKHPEIIFAYLYLLGGESDWFEIDGEKIPERFWKECTSTPLMKELDEAAMSAAERKYNW